MLRSFTRRWPGMVLGGLGLLAACVALAEPAGRQAPPTASPADKKEVDPFVVPEGTPAQLVEYLNGLRQARPKNLDPETIAQFRTQLSQALLTAAERVLAQSKLTEEQAMTAVYAKLAALNISARNDPQIESKLETFRSQLEKSGWPKFARQVQAVIFQQRLQNPGDLNKIVADIKQFIGAQPQADDVALVMRLGMALERSGRTELAATTLTEYSRLFGSSAEPRVAAWAAKFAGVARRLTLPGKPMELEGLFVDGQPLDWKAYQGKVVLIDFWATWCGPCLAELPNVKKAYALYHARGFDVLGISLDHQRAPLEAFLKQREIPWKILFSDKEGQTGFDAPMAVRYGVMSIPCMLLVGKDGNVLSLTARGPQLMEELSRQLGPVEEKPAVPAPSKPKS